MNENSLKWILIEASVSFLLTALIGRILIPALRALHAGQSIKKIGPFWHSAKEGTPTMGGLMFISAILITVLIFGIRQIRQGQRGFLWVYLFALTYAVIGFLDDSMKIRHRENTGLSAKQKFILQVAAALLFILLLHAEGYLNSAFYIPFLQMTISVPFPIYVLLACFIMVGTVNSVNLTDGVDGLSSSVTIPVSVFFIAVFARWHRTDLSLISAVMLGALFGFLLYNHYPAKVFMGDTGSLFLGGMVSALAFAGDMPLVLILVGFVYLEETVSDILQVAYFRKTGGKRLFKMAPLHHHLELCGWSERKIVLIFTLVSTIFCAIAYAGILGRN